MVLVKSILTWAMKKRINQIDLFLNHPLDVQNDTFLKLIHTAKQTEWGIKYRYNDINTIKDFQERVPLSTYEDYSIHINRIIKGEQNILWPTKIDWFSKSSGTTNTRSKFIPVSRESLEDCHFKAGKDLLTLYIHNFPEKDIFAGKMIPIGGSTQVNPFNPNSYFGDVSAIIMKNMPHWAKWTRGISLETALMENWDRKIELIIEEASKVNITTLGGVPTWTIILLQKMLEHTGKKNILEVWPNLEVFFHGAVAFDPYREQFDKLIPKGSINYQETYSASEGFFGIQDNPDCDSMLLMLDYGIFYEFIPMEHWNKVNPPVITLNEVQLNKNYALVISTNAGLWRYIIGDTIKFTSLHPFRIKITGRTKHFINAFGEEVIIENTDEAITFACEQTNALLDNYTVAPIYLSNSAGGHEWIIEFQKEPNNVTNFARKLDTKLREINSDYDGKRYHDIALVSPKIHFAPRGTFYDWMESKNKLGGQNKVPRLVNNRDMMEELLSFIKTSKSKKNQD